MFLFFCVISFAYTMTDVNEDNHNSYTNNLYSATRSRRTPTNLTGRYPSVTKQTLTQGTPFSLLTVPNVTSVPTLLRGVCARQLEYLSRNSNSDKNIVVMADL